MLASTLKMEISFKVLLTRKNTSLIFYLIVIVAVYLFIAIFIDLINKNVTWNWTGKRDVDLRKKS